MDAKLRTGAFVRSLNNTKIKSEVSAANGSWARSRTIRRIAVLSTTALISLATFSAQVSAQAAAEQFWDTSPEIGTLSGDGTWDSATPNWTQDGGVSNQAFSSGINAVFGDVFGTATVTVVGAQTIANLQFDSGTYVIQAGANGSLVIPVNVTSVITAISAGATTTIAVPISGDGALQINIAGTLNLQGTLSYTGGTVINAGIVTLNAINQLPIGGDLTIASGTLKLNGNGQLIGNLSGTGGTIDAGTDGILTNNQTVNATFAGNWAGAFGIGQTSFIKNGAATLTLTGTSSQTGIGILEINDGKIQVQNGNAIADTFIVQVTGSLELLSDEAIGNVILSNGGQVLLGNNTLTLAGDGDAINTQVFAGGPTSTGTISGTGSLIIDSGNDTTTIAGTNTYTGATAVKSGTLRLSSGGSLRSTDITVSGGTLNVKGGALLGTAGTAKDAAVKVSAGTFGVSGAETLASLDLSGTGTVAITGASSMTVTGATKISGGALTTPAGTPLNTASFALTGGTVNGSATADGTGTDVDGANVNSGYAVVALGGTVTSVGATGIDAAATGAATIQVQTADNSANIAGNTGVINNTAANGIGIKTTAETGKTTINLGANVTALGDAIQASSTTGDIVITGAGNVTGGTVVGADGIQITTTSGNATVDLTGTISGDPGILMSSTTGGDLTVSGTGDVTGLAEGIKLSTTGGSGNILINRDGNISGGTGAGIYAKTDGGAVSIVVTAGKTVSATSENAIYVENTSAASTNSITNSGTVLGTFNAVGGNDTFATLASGLWAPSALNGGASTSDFGAGTDIVNNAGTFRASDQTNTNAGNVLLQGLEAFTNTGKIDLQNGASGVLSITADTLTIANAGAGTTTFNGGGTLEMDAFVDRQGASDTLTIGTAGDANNNGVVTGVTQIVLNDTNAVNAGQSDLIGTELVRVENTVAGAGAAKGAFVLAGGAIKKGLWSYDIYLDTTRAQAGRATADVFVLASAPAQSTENFTDIVNGAQNAFNVSANVVSSRQQGNRIGAKTTRSRAGDGNGEYGFWLKGASARLGRTASSTFTLFGTPSTTNTSYKQSLSSGVLGADFALQDPGGRAGDLVMGFFAGAISGNQTFDASTATASTKGATMGVYASYNLDSGVYADFSLQQDRFKTTWADPALVGTAGYAPQTIPGKNSGISIGGGYKMALSSPGSWIDPFFTLNYVSTKYDSFTTAGATVAMGTNKSMRAKVGVRAGSEVQTDTAKYNFFASGALVRENLASNNVTMTGGASTFTVNSQNQFSALNVGLGVDVQGFNSPWSISARADADAGAKANGIAATLEFGFKF